MRRGFPVGRMARGSAALVTVALLVRRRSKKGRGEPPEGPAPFPRRTFPDQNCDQRYWFVTSWWKRISEPFTCEPSAFGQRSADTSLSSA